VAVIGSWYARSKSSSPNVPVLSAPFASEKLSTNGKVIHAVLSPDGRNVVYTSGKDTEKESVWLRQLNDGSNIEIIPPSDDLYFGLAFSPGGDTLYFVRAPRLAGEPPGIYRVSIFGGIPQKIIGAAEGWISISPDGTKISFVRSPRLDEENYSLWIADSADGRNERKLAVRPRPFRIGDNEFAPDGESIAFAVGQSENGANDFGLAEVSLETGAEREISQERFFNVKALAWLPDKSGWLITASRIPNRNVRIWQLSARGGEAEPVTKDSETYGILSLNKEATKIVSTLIKPDFDARLISLENPAASREAVADAGSISFAPDGKIYFSSGMSGNEEIWSIDRDGSGRRQLTNTEADESLPLPAPDGNSVIFLSNRSGAAQVWRMNADGSLQTQVTSREGGYPLFVSPDGEWVFYHHGINRTLWRVSLKTGEEQMVFSKAKAHFAVSPDASQIAYSEKQGDKNNLTITALADGQTVKTFPLADEKSLLRQIAWTPDGKNLAYITADRDYGNHILWMQPLNENMPRQTAALGDKETSGFGLAISPDGKTLGITQGEWLHDAVLLKGLR
jgi:Tol biopolymer transport system component